MALFSLKRSESQTREGPLPPSDISCWQAGRRGARTPSVGEADHDQRIDANKEADRPAKNKTSKKQTHKKLFPISGDYRLRSQHVRIFAASEHTHTHTRVAIIPIICSSRFGFFCFFRAIAKPVSERKNKHSREEAKRTLVLVCRRLIENSSRERAVIPLSINPIHNVLLTKLIVFAASRVRFSNYRPLQLAACLAYSKRSALFSARTSWDPFVSRGAECTLSLG